MNAHEVATRLALDAEGVASMLLPAGSREGQEWVCGNVQGKEGRSLKVRLTGEKVGRWSDFATEQSGDLLDLWAATRGIPFAEAFRQAREYLGVRTPTFVAPRPTYQKPAKPAIARLSGKVLTYLTEERKLSADTLTAFKVAASPDDSTIVFPYLRDGELINAKHLALAREGGKKKIRQEKAAEPCLFGWQAIDETVSCVVICEGEIDAMSLHQYGIPALSVNQGAGNHQWIDSDYDRLARFREIAIWFDSDEPGQKGAHEVAARLGIERCRIITTPNGLKDANECLLKGVSREDMLLAIGHGECIAPAALKAPTAFTDEVLALFSSGGPSMTGIALPWAPWQDKVRLRPSELSVWTGINGHGKSDLLGYVILNTICQGERVCIFSGEMQPAKLLYRLTLQACGTGNPCEEMIRAAHAWMEGSLWIYDCLGSTDVDAMLEAFQYAAKRYGVTHFLIDSLMKCGIDEDDYRGQKAFMDRLCDFKNEYGCHIHLVAHPRKGEDETQQPGKLDIKGTGAISDLADNVFTVWRNKKGENEKKKKVGNAYRAYSTLVICDKQRDGGHEGALRLWFDRDSHQFHATASQRSQALFDFPLPPPKNREDA